MYRKKKAIDAEAVFVSTLLPRKLIRIAIIIMQIDRAAHPQIIVHLRPMRSNANAGKVLPTTNMS